MGVCCSGSGNIPFTARMLNAGGESTAISKAAFDLNVAESSIICVNKWEGAGQAVYILQVGDNSDETFRYEKIGTTYRRNQFKPPYIDGINQEGQPSNHPVISKVAFDLGVNKSSIKMVRKREGMGDGDYILQVGDKYLKYKKIGSCYLPENQAIV